LKAQHEKIIRHQKYEKSIPDDFIVVKSEQKKKRNRAERRKHVPSKKH